MLPLPQCISLHISVPCPAVDTRFSQPSASGDYSCRSAGLYNEVLQLSARPCRSVHRLSHSGQHYMGHKGATCNPIGFAPQTRLTLKYPGMRVGGSKTHQANPLHQTVNNSFLQAWKQEERLCSGGNQSFHFHFVTTALHSRSLF